jgi:hypothetical protein
MGSLSNISLADFRKFLLHIGCARIRKSGGHEMWARKGMRRSIALQTHIDPVPERIIRQSIRNLDMTREEFEGIMQTL